MVNIIISRTPGIVPYLIETSYKHMHPVVLVPESFTLSAEQALIEHSPNCGLLGLQVYSPVSLVRDIGEIAGLKSLKKVTEEGRRMLMSLLLQRSKEDLLFYKENVRQAGMADKLISQIDDLAEGNFDPQSLMEAARNLPAASRYKCSDLALLWSRYRDSMKNGYADAAMIWEESLKRLGTSGIVNKKDLIICGFDGLTKDLSDLIYVADRLADSVTVIIPGACGKRDGHIFEYTNFTVDRFIKQYGDWIQIQVDRYHYSASEHGTDKGISFLEGSVYGGVEGTVPDLSSVSAYYAPDTTAECLNAVQQLTVWKREGIEWKDMAVAMCSGDAFADMLPLVLASSGIPYSMRGGVPLASTEYARYVLHILRSLRTGYAQADMLSLAKSPFSGMESDDAMDLENYAVSHGMDKYRWTYEIKGKDADKIEPLRRSLIDPLMDIRKKISSSECTGREAARVLYEHIEKSGAYEKLLAYVSELEADGRHDVADKTRQSWGAINEILDQMAMLAPEDHLPADQFCLMIESAIVSKKLKSLPQTVNSVLVADPGMIFSAGIPAVAMIGLQENAALPPSTLLTGPECVLLSSSPSGRKTYGVGITKSQFSSKIKKGIYNGFASAKTRLMISCSAAEPDGKVLSPAQAYMTVTGMLRAQHPENITGGLEDDRLRPFSPSFALERIASSIREWGKNREEWELGAELPEEWDSALRFLYNDERWHERMASVIGHLDAGLVDNGIAPELAEELYGMQMSVSTFETAGACPYWGFLSYAVRAKLRKSFTFETDSVGTFSHKVLRRFFDAAIETPGWPDISDGEVTRILNRVLKEETQEWKDGPLGKNLVGRYHGGEIIRFVRTCVMNMIRSIRLKPHFVPVGMEVGFGAMHTGSKMHFPEVKVKLSDGREVKVRGSIDRIDTMQMEDGRKAVMLYDFKSSDKDVHLQSLEEGLQVQLPLYLTAVQQGMPGYVLAGALYQPVRQVYVDEYEEDREAVEKKMDKMLSSRGIYLDDDTLKKACYPVKIPARYSSSDVISVMSEEELAETVEKGKESAREVAQRMLDGVTTPMPVQDGAVSPCSYCKMRDACQFDERLAECKVRVLDHTAPLKTVKEEKDA